ncbi:MAG: GNAT family N-acetyltransferase [Gammaproteobacteria bacterium]|nr:GNAT family N-acetyltransferase [Gammaproteobacteria bacterium]MDH5653723.1 GNAT family N-acetyltransferase [Gammaproteobacteria bacterium]
MIEVIDKDNLAEVLPLIREYLVFYAVKDIDDSRTAEFFSQFGPESDKGCQFGYRMDGRLVAFATVYFTYATSILSKVAVMNDLYTLEEYRHRGIATALIKHCAAYAIEQQAVRLQWLTANDNLTAQSVYSALNAEHSKWVFYTYTP